jgi:putative MATE family efflux protein
VAAKAIAVPCFKFLMQYFKRFFDLLKQAFSHTEQDFTVGSINKAIFLLAVPMLMEMVMESLFAIVDTYFVGKLGALALATIGLTESMLTIVYSIGIGISMAATSIVARRVGEKNNTEASKSGAQAISLAVIISIFISLAGLFFSDELLGAMGASAAVVEYGSNYTKIALTGNIVIMLLFLINGVFRGAGNAVLSFRSLLIANLCNIVFCPLFIHGFNWGITGAALATLCGRSIGVLYQLYHLNKKEGIIQTKWLYYLPSKQYVLPILNIAYTATLQFIIASGSWIFLNRIIAAYGEDTVAGYTVAIRILIFFIMPAWGISNAAATLVGQNLGANNAQRAAQSAWQTAKVNALFMAVVTLICLLFGNAIISFFDIEGPIKIVAKDALQVISLGYVFYGVGMVILNAFNGAGDSKTPTIINFCCYWCFQIPLAIVLAKQLQLGKQGIYYAIIIAEALTTIVAVYWFKKGKWQHVKL